MNVVFYSVGAVLSKLFVQTAALERQRFTIPSPDASSERTYLHRFIRYYIGHKAERNHGDLEEVHKNFWRNQQQSDWYRYSLQRHETFHVPMLAHVVERVRPYVEQHRIRQVSEFGTGSGMWLDYLSHQWPTVQRFVGIDLSADQLALSKQQFPRLEFACADILAWTEANASSGSIFLTNCGVLEYLSQASVQRLLALIGAKACGSLILFVEPVEVSQDPEKDLDSKPFGNEMSFSHNHVHLLKQAGFEVLMVEDLARDGYRWRVVLAEVPA